MKSVSEAASAPRQVYLCSDYLALAEDMRSLFLASGLFRPTQRTVASVIPAATSTLCQPSSPATAIAAAADGDASSGSVGMLPSVVSWAESAASGRRRGWLGWRPFVLPTERDQVCEQAWRPAYRALLTRA